MAREMKVYCWMDFARRAQNEERPWQRQTICIVAAYSKAEVVRLAGYDRPGQMSNLGETGNAQDIEQATLEPGTISWTWLDERGPSRTYKRWEDR